MNMSTHTDRRIAHEVSKRLVEIKNTQGRIMTADKLQARREAESVVRYREVNKIS